MKGWKTVADILVVVGGQERKARGNVEGRVSVADR